jgi:hypothetical protein
MRLPTSPPLPELRWYNLKEVSAQLNRSTGYLHRLIREHDLPRRKVREGRHPRRIVEVSWPTLRALQRILNR